jgi:mRNA interferase HigB
LHVISRKTLREAASRLNGSRVGLDAWFRIASKAEWKSLEDIRKTYRCADGVTVGGKTYVIFNISGNRFRLIVKVEYRYQKIFIKHVLTHAEYDKEDWKR